MVLPALRLFRSLVSRYLVKTAVIDNIPVLKEYSCLFLEHLESGYEVRLEVRVAGADAVEELHDGLVLGLSGFEGLAVGGVFGGEGVWVEKGSVASHCGCGNDDDIV